MALAFSHQGTLVIVLDEENIERIQQADPFDFNSGFIGEPIAFAIPLRITIAYARKDEQEKIVALQSTPDKLMAYLARGFKLTESDGTRGQPYNRVE